MASKSQQRKEQDELLIAIRKYIENRARLTYIDFVLCESELYNERKKYNKDYDAIDAELTEFMGNFLDRYNLQIIKKGKRRENKT